MMQIRIVDLDEGRDFIIFTEGHREEVAALLNALNCAEHLAAIETGP